MNDLQIRTNDPFIRNYQQSELNIAAEFLMNWLPFLSRDLCRNCTQTLRNRVRSLDPELCGEAESLQLREGLSESSLTHRHVHEESHDNCDDCDSDTNSLGSWKDSANGWLPEVSTSGNNSRAVDTNSIGSWKDGANGWSDHVPDVSTSGANSQAITFDQPGTRMSWADMAQEDELEEDEEIEEEGNKQNLAVDCDPQNAGGKVQKNLMLSREQREYIRFMNVKRRKDFICLERIKGKLVNILDRLELHSGVFSAAEQKRIVDFVYGLEEKGRKGELRERTFSAPQKWMRGKGRVTIQFGCCYNYAIDKIGNPPGILRNEHVDPIPHLFKVIIRRLVGWHILPPSCVPDSCIVNIYDEGDCIPPHIDNHDFVRPFCTVSFLSECNILFGSSLKPLGPGEFSGATAIPLPVGSVLVLNGNGADVAKHCVPAVPTKRISITFRKMDEAKHPFGFVPESDLQGLQPLPYDVDESKGLLGAPPQMNRQPVIREVDSGMRRGFLERGSYSEPRYSDRPRSKPAPRQRMRVSLGT